MFHIEESHWAILDSSKDWLSRNRSSCQRNDSFGYGRKTIFRNQLPWQPRSSYSCYLSSPSILHDLRSSATSASPRSLCSRDSYSQPRDDTNLSFSSRNHIELALMQKPSGSNSTRRVPIPSQTRNQLFILNRGEVLRRQELPNNRGSGSSNNQTIQFTLLLQWNHRSLFEGSRCNEGVGE